MYMSYCRNEGALAEVRCALSDVDAHIDEDAEYSVSEREIDCFKSLITELYDWMCERELIDCNGELDTDGLEEICEKMRHGYNERDCYES